jgi:hypothetical protein
VRTDRAGCRKVLPLSCSAAVAALPTCVAVVSCVVPRTYDLGEIFWIENGVYENSLELKVWDDSDGSSQKVSFVAVALVDLC